MKSIKNFSFECKFAQNIKSITDYLILESEIVLNRYLVRQIMNIFPNIKKLKFSDPQSICLQLKSKHEFLNPDQLRLSQLE
jgi:hypothetical protein